MPRNLRHELHDVSRSHRSSTSQLLPITVQGFHACSEKDVSNNEKRSKELVTLLMLTCKILRADANNDDGQRLS